MSVYKEYHHVIKSLEVYPRVHFFSKRYHDIKEKYRKFTDKSQKKLSIKHDEAPQNSLENGFTIKVVGKEDLDPTVFIAAGPHLYKTLPSSETGKETGLTYDTIVPVNPNKDCIRSSSTLKTLSGTKDIRTSDSTIDDTGKACGSHTTTVVIFNDIIESLDDQGFEEIKQLWKGFEHKRVHESIGYFLLCQSNQGFKKSNEDDFRRKLNRHFGDCLKLIHIITRGSTDEIRMKDEISLYLEDKVIKNLLIIESDLQRYTTGKKRNNTPEPLVEGKDIQLTVGHFLQKVPTYGEELTKAMEHTGSPKNANSTEKQLSDLSIKDNESSKVRLTRKCLKDDRSMIEELALIVKCSVAQAISNRHHIPVEHCNHILIQEDFEQRCVTMFSASLNYYVTKLWTCAAVANSAMKCLYQTIFPRVILLLQKDLCSFVTEIEKEINLFATTLRILLFEISSCLKKTKVDIEKVKVQTSLDKPKVDIDLRKEILSIKEVYGVGTIYGQLEIHIDDTGAIERVGSQIRDLLRRKNVACPFSVRAVEVEFETLADHTLHEHGERLECQTRTGTLAGFVEGSDHKLYGLTCAHVVNAEEECDVFIYDGSDSRLEFAKCVPHLRVSTGTSNKPLIDLAAVRVNNSVKDRCNKFLKNDECMLNPGVMAADTTEDLAGTYVYKHGAATQFTKGLVFSDDYSSISNEDTNYTFLIENYEGDGDSFAKPGDSGSMICAPDEEEVYIVKAVGVLNGRRITPPGEDTPAFFSFRLVDGLRTLTQRAQGLQFNFPKTC